MNREKLALKIISSISEEPAEPSMIIAPHPYNSQEYTPENCEKRNIPYIPGFVDIDTYIKESGEMRMQGYFPIRKLSDLNLSMKQLDFILELVNSDSTWAEYDGSYILEIWTHYIPASLDDWTEIIS